MQEAFLEEARALGFGGEAKGLFQAYATPGLRPDYYLPVGVRGILVEVEHGKTTINDMHLLDLWKCHVCAEAHYLFLVAAGFGAEPTAGARQALRVRRQAHVDVLHAATTPTCVGRRCSGYRSVGRPVVVG